MWPELYDPMLICSFRVGSKTKLGIIVYAYCIAFFSLSALETETENSAEET